MATPSLLPSIAMDTAGETNRGLTRKVNEDHFLIASMHKVMQVEGTSLASRDHQTIDGGTMARLLLVADGVSGAPGAEQASQLTVDAVLTYVATSMRCFFGVDKRVQADLLEALEASVEACHALVKEKAKTNPASSGMATTLTYAHIMWPRAYIVHVGDSRAYLLRHGGIRQLTKDQTLAQGLVDRGVLSQEAAAGSQFSNVLASAVGSDMEPVIRSIDLAPGDSILLCTDGLTKHVPDQEINSIVTTARSAYEACQQLVHHALDGGGTDNITAVVSRFGEEFG